MTTSHTNLIDVALQYHDALPKRIREYLNGRGIPDHIINSNILGWNGWRITIPIYNRQGEVVFFKLAKGPEDSRPASKMLTSPGAGVELYGWDRVLQKPQQIVICEGEFDRLVLEAQGFFAVTSTGGASTFRQEWAKAIRAIPQVYACFDRDQAGLNGAMLVTLMIPHAKVVELPQEVGEAGDVTDYFVRLKRSPEEFARLLEAAHPAKPLARQERNRGSSRVQSTNSLLTKRIQRIKRAMPIAEVVSQYVNLRSSGRTLVGRCPFHDDRIPSFVIYPHSETFHCFGCRAHGDVINFVQQMEGMNFGQALEALDQSTSNYGDQSQQNQPEQKAA
jgi:DNA primase